MGHWGWRPALLALFISVWIAGCQAAQEVASIVTPTEYPPITLFVYTPATSSSPTPLGLPIIATFHPTSTPEYPPEATGTATPTLDTLWQLPTPTPLPLVVTPPTCYATSDDGILCLGRVDNNQPHPITQVTLQVSLLQADGTLLRTAVVVIAQRQIPSGESAPYHLFFPAEEGESLVDQFGGVYVTLLRAEAASDDPTPELQILAEQGEKLAGRYVAAIELYNPGPAAARNIRLVATLYTDAGHVVGYRVVEIGALWARATRTVEIEISPIVSGLPLQHTWYVEAES